MVQAWSVKVYISMDRFVCIFDRAIDYGGKDLFDLFDEGLLNIRMVCNKCYPRLS